MSRTKKGSKSPGYEYWGKRPYSVSGRVKTTSMPPGPVSKRFTHRKERRIAEREIRQEMKNPHESLPDD